MRNILLPRFAPRRNPDPTKALPSKIVGAAATAAAPTDPAAAATAASAGAVTIMIGLE